MAIEVKGLADTVRAAKEMVRKASDEAAKMADSAERLKETIAQVTQVRQELDDAQAELQAALGAMTNGGPSLWQDEGSYEGATFDATTAKPPFEEDIPAADVPTVEDDVSPSTADIEAALKAAANKVRQNNTSTIV